MKENKEEHATGCMWPTKPKVYTVWPFAGKCLPPAFHYIPNKSRNVKNMNNKNLMKIWGEKVWKRVKHVSSLMQE